MKDSVCIKEAQRVSMLDLRSSLASSDGPRFGCNDNSQYLLVHSSLQLKERIPSMEKRVPFFFFFKFSSFT